DRLEEALENFRAVEPPEGLAPFHAQLDAGAGETLAALGRFLDPGPPQEAVARVLDSLRRGCRALEAFYPLRAVLPPLGRHFVESPWHGRLGTLDPDPPPAFGAGVGLHRAGADEDLDARGGFSLYVPEWLAGEAPRPLVVALHGGIGHGRDFLWSWLREARGRGFLLLAPTSVGSTWSLDAPPRDALRLRSMVDWVSARWPVDRERILLTGLSDGGTFTLLAGLDEDAPYTALAPMAGVLHPHNFSPGNLARARGRRIYQVHGSLDWLFPPAVARVAREELERAGADLVYREIEDLSHTHPREVNGDVLAWFDPSLGLPRQS
ncbi:MAG TPA: phospholipase, partial [Myxococcota bacterium]|nr:phospholipase [Myxococcota bacterium]